MTNDSLLSPMEYNVVIRMDATEMKTPGGIILPESKKDRDELATDEGTMVAVSPHAFNYAEWGDHAPPQVGDRVLFAQYSGRLWKRGEITYRILKDKDIVAVVEAPALLSAVA